MDNKKIYKYGDDYVIKFGWGQYASILNSTTYSRDNEYKGMQDTGKTLADIVKFIESKQEVNYDR